MTSTLNPTDKTQMKKREYFITIDSRDRDRATWPLSSHFEVKMEPPDGFKGAALQRKFRNVKCVELVSAVFPNTNNVLDELYIYLTIPEIDGIYESTNLEGGKAFAKLLPKHVIGKFVHAYIDDYDKPRRVYKAQGVRLDRLTIQFKKWNGELFNFGADTTSGQSPDNTVQTSITLKITVADPYVH